MSMHRRVALISLICSAATLPHAAAAQGKVVSINHIVVAADGKSRTSTTTGTNADGQKIHNVVVYDKQ